MERIQTGRCRHSKTPLQNFLQGSRPFIQNVRRHEGVSESGKPNCADGRCERRDSGTARKGRYMEEGNTL